MQKIYLTYFQAMIFMHRLKEIRTANPCFNNEIVQLFESHVVAKARELSSSAPNLIKKLNPNYDKFIVTKNMYDYLVSLTDVDPLEKETMEKYAPIIARIYERAQDVLSAETAKINYEPLNVNNLSHVESLKSLWYDSDFRKYFNLWQPDFEMYIKELAKPFRTNSQFMIRINNNYVGWICSPIAVDNNRRVAMLDIAILKEFRGKGLAKKIITDYISYANLDEILIEIHSDNIVSQGLAISLGFEPYKIDEEDGIIKYQLICHKKEDSKTLGDSIEDK